MSADLLKLEAYTTQEVKRRRPHERGLYPSRRDKNHTIRAETRKNLWPIPSKRAKTETKGAQASRNHGSLSLETWKSQHDRNTDDVTGIMPSEMSQHPGEFFIWDKNVVLQLRWGTADETVHYQL